MIAGTSPNSTTASIHRVLSCRKNRSRPGRGSGRRSCGSRMPRSMSPQVCDGCVLLEHLGVHDRRQHHLDPLRRLSSKHYLHRSIVLPPPDEAPVEQREKRPLHRSRRATPHHPPATRCSRTRSRSAAVHRCVSEPVAWRQSLRPGAEDPRLSRVPTRARSPAGSQPHRPDARTRRAAH